jgi:hypothetical protein
MKKALISLIKDTLLCALLHKSDFRPTELSRFGFFLERNEEATKVHVVVIERAQSFENYKENQVSLTADFMSELIKMIGEVFELNFNRFRRFEKWKESS